MTCPYPVFLETVAAQSNCLTSLNVSDIHSFGFRRDHEILGNLLKDHISKAKLLTSRSFKYNKDITYIKI